MRGTRIGEMLVRWTPHLMFLLFVGLIALWDFHERSQRKARNVEREEWMKEVPVERRHDGLNVSVFKGLRLMGVWGCERIEVGSFEIRKKKIGFLRVGALNEAIVRDVRVVVRAGFFEEDGDFDVNWRRFAAQNGVAAGNDRRSANTPVSANSAAVRNTASFGRVKGTPGEFSKGLASELLGALWHYSPYRDQSVSGILVRNLEFVLQRDDGSELCLLQCNNASPRSGKGADVTGLQGNVIFRNMRGEFLRCDEAVLALSGNPVVFASRGTVDTTASIHRFEKISFRLASLFQDASFVPQNGPPADAVRWW